MALTRKMLESMGLSEAQIQAIIDEHTSVTDAIRAERDSYKETANKVEELNKQLEEEKKKTESISQKDEAYNTLKTEFEEYKANIQNEKDSEAKKSQYKTLLTESKISDTVIDSIINTVDFKSIELDENGAIKDKDNHLKTIKDKWGGFITKQELKANEPPTPPNSEPTKSYTYEELGKLSQAEFDKYLNSKKPL